MIEESVISRVLGTALRTGGDFAEVFVEDKRSSSAVLDDGKVEELTSGRDRGAGIRVVVGDTTGFAHTADLTEAGLSAAAEAAAAAARGGGGGTRTVALTRADAPPPTWSRSSPATSPRPARSSSSPGPTRRPGPTGGAISQVSASYGDSRRRILVANSDGLLAGDDQVKTFFAVSCVATGDTGMQTGRESVGHTVGFELFDRYDVDELARTRRRPRPHQAPGPPGAAAARCRWSSAPAAVACCSTRPAATASRPTWWARAPRCSRAGSGELVASPPVTLVDDGTMGGEWGCFAVDDEGHAAQRNVLIQDGVLTDYMWDLLRARKEGRQSSGNGRRQSYQHLPMVRMTNTYLLDGPDDPAEIIASTDKGVYVKHLGGGQVNTATGDFVFGMTEAYLIENGEITEPLREGNLIGNGPEVLTRIDALGNDFAMGPPGTCGKDGQGVPVGDGVPTLRVSSLTIGGTAA